MELKYKDKIFKFSISDDAIDVLNQFRIMVTNCTGFSIREDGSLIPIVRSGEDYEVIQIAGNFVFYKKHEPITWYEKLDNILIYCKDLLKNVLSHIISVCKMCFQPAIRPNSWHPLFYTIQGFYHTMFLGKMLVLYRKNNNPRYITNMNDVTKLFPKYPENNEKSYFKYLKIDLARYREKLDAITQYVVLNSNYNFVLRSLMNRKCIKPINMPESQEFLKMLGIQYAIKNIQPNWLEANFPRNSTPHMTHLKNVLNNRDLIEAFRFEKDIKRFDLYVPLGENNQSFNIFQKYLKKYDEEYKKNLAKTSANQNIHHMLAFSRLITKELLEELALKYKFNLYYIGAGNNERGYHNLYSSKDGLYKVKFELPNKKDILVFSDSDYFVDINMYLSTGRVIFITTTIPIQENAQSKMKFIYEGNSNFTTSVEGGVVVSNSFWNYKLDAYTVFDDKGQMITYDVMSRVTPWEKSRLVILMFPRRSNNFLVNRLFSPIPGPVFNPVSRLKIIDVIFRNSTYGMCLVQYNDQTHVLVVPRGPGHHFQMLDSAVTVNKFNNVGTSSRFMTCDGEQLPGTVQFANAISDCIPEQLDIIKLNLPCEYEESDRRKKLEIPSSISWIEEINKRAMVHRENLDDAMKNDENNKQFDHSMEKYGLYLDGESASRDDREEYNVSVDFSKNNSISLLSPMVVDKLVLPDVGNLEELKYTMMARYISAFPKSQMKEGLLKDIKAIVNDFCKAFFQFGAHEPLIPLSNEELMSDAIVTPNVQNRVKMYNPDENIKQFFVFNKNEPVKEEKSARLIVKSSDKMLVELSRYTSPFKYTYLIDQPWYGPKHNGMTLGPFMQQDTETQKWICTDFTAFDGSISEPIRNIMERNIYKRAFSEDYHEAMDELWDIMMTMEVGWLTGNKTDEKFKFKFSGQRGSGEKLTTDGNTTINAISNYVALRRLGYTKMKAYLIIKKSLFAGDDAMMPAPDDWDENKTKLYVSIMESMNFKVKVEICSRNSVKFLSRIFDLDTGASLLDYDRMINKLGIMNNSKYPWYQQFYNKLVGYAIGDPYDPVVIKIVEMFLVPLIKKYGPSGDNSLRNDTFSSEQIYKIYSMRSWYVGDNTKLLSLHRVMFQRYADLEYAKIFDVNKNKFKMYNNYLPSVTQEESNKTMKNINPDQPNVKQEGSEQKKVEPKGGNVPTFQDVLNQGIGISHSEFSKLPDAVKIDLMELWQLRKIPDPELFFDNSEGATWRMVTFLDGTKVKYKYKDVKINNKGKPKNKTIHKTYNTNNKSKVSGGKGKNRKN